MATNGHHPMGKHAAKRTARTVVPPTTLGAIAHKARAFEGDVEEYLNNAEQAVVARGKTLARTAKGAITRSVRTAKSRPVLTASIALGTVAILVAAGFGLSALLAAEKAETT